MPSRLNEAINTQLSTGLLERNDVYNRLGNLVSTYLALPALRGFWSGGVVGPGKTTSGLANLIDQSGLGNDLTDNGTRPLFGYENLIPYVDYDGSADSHYITDASSNNGFDILGTENYIVNPGLTLGGWFRSDVTMSTSTSLIGKGLGTGNQRSYRMFGYLTGNNPEFQVSPDGTSGTSVAVISSEAMIINTWSFVVARFDPSSELAIWVNDIKDTNITGIPAAIFDSSANFEIAATNNQTTSWFNGQVSMAFVCASALSDSIVNALFQQGKILYGV